MIKTFVHDYFITCQTRIHVREETVADKIDLRTGQSCLQCNHKLFFFVPAHFLLFSKSFERVLVIAFQGQMIKLQKLKEQFYGPCMLQPELCSTGSRYAIPFPEATLENYLVLAAVWHSIAEVVIQTFHFVLIQLMKQVHEPVSQLPSCDCVQSYL